ncbi:MAG: hypothetical protein AB2L22_17890 [Syntrophales bacterium]
MSLKRKSQEVGKTHEQKFAKTFEAVAGTDMPPTNRDIEDILSGVKELPDDLFFKLISDSPLYLSPQYQGKACFQDKVCGWIIEGRWNMVERLKATLEPERRGRKAEKSGGFKSLEIAETYWRYVFEIQEFLAEHEEKNKAEKKLLWKKCHPDDPAVPDFLRHHTAEELAIDPTCLRHDIKERLLRNIIKHVRPARIHSIPLSCRPSS